MQELWVGERQGLPPPLEDLSREPPAVANLLLHGGTPNGDALAATVIDLAAKDVIEIEELSTTDHLCRVPSDAPPVELAPFERRVLNLLRDRAVGGSVPARALAIGVEDETDAWWRGFAAEVSDEADRRGYVSRWFAVGAVAALGLLGLAALVLLIKASGSSSRDLRNAAALTFAAAVVGFYLLPGVMEWQRLSRRGHEQAHWWVQARHVLGADHGFAPVRAAGVAIWDGYLSSAVALGLAPAAAHDVPIGPDGAAATWVRRGDAWNRVQVRYPRRVPPGWGRHPLHAAAVGLASSGVSAWLLVAAARRGAWHPDPPFSDDVATVIGDLEPAIGGVALIGFVLGIWQLALALADLVRTPRTEAGVVAARWDHQGGRLNPWRDFFPRQCFVVLDDGVSTHLRGIRVSQDLFNSIERGDTIELTVTPSLRHVRRVAVEQRAHRSRSSRS